MNKFSLSLLLGVAFCTTNAAFAMDDYSYDGGDNPYAGAKGPSVQSHIVSAGVLPQELLDLETTQSLTFKQLEELKKKGKIQTTKGWVEPFSSEEFAQTFSYLNKKIHGETRLVDGPIKQNFEFLTQYFKYEGDDEVTFIFAPRKHKMTIPNPWVNEDGYPTLDIFFKTQEVVLKKIEEPTILAAVSTATVTSLPYEYMPGYEPSSTASPLASYENTYAFENVPFKLNPTGYSEKVEEQDGIITVTTHNDYNASYQLMTDRFAVTVGNKIKVTYDIKVENGGQMSAGLLNTNGDGWIGEEIVMPAGSYHNSFEVIVPEGERDLCLVLRNYHLGKAGQTTFKVNHLNIMKTN